MILNPIYTNEGRSALRVLDIYVFNETKIACRDVILPKFGLINEFCLQTSIKSIKLASFSSTNLFLTAILCWINHLSKSKWPTRAVAVNSCRLVAFWLLPRRLIVYIFSFHVFFIKNRFILQKKNINGLGMENMRVNDEYLRKIN